MLRLLRLWYHAFMNQKLSDQQLQALADYLLLITTDSGVKLRWGYQQREQMRQVLQKGQVPKGYRADWIKKTKMALIDTLHREAEVFNDTYRHDLISVNDMADALSTTLETLRVACRKIEEQGKMD
jgi:hypothetical protein